MSNFVMIECVYFPTDIPGVSNRSDHLRFVPNVGFFVVISFKVNVQFNQINRDQRSMAHSPVLILFIEYYS